LFDENAIAGDRPEEIRTALDSSKTVISD